MATDVREVHVLVQDAERGSAQWWRERSGAGPSDVAVQDLPLSPRHGIAWTARHWATDRARDLGAPPEQLQDIALLTSELVGNAVVHGGGGQVEVRFGAVDRLIMIAVSDFGGGRRGTVVELAMSGLGRAVDVYSALAPAATVGEGLAVRGEEVDSAAAEVDRWLSSTGLL